MGFASKRLLWLVGVGVGCGLAQNVCAGILAYGAGYIGQYSDNIRLAPSNPEREWINDLMVGATYLENGPTLAARVTGQADYLNYVNKTYGDGPLYYADASAIWSIAPERAEWSLADRADQVVLDAALPTTPNNVTNSNVLSTGPDVFLHLGDINTLALGARYGNAQYGQGDIDSSRYGGSARWLYATSRDLTYSLNYVYTDVAFVNDVLNTNYTRRDVYARADLRQKHNRFLLDFGGTRIIPDRGAEVDEPTIRLTWNEQLTSTSSVGVLLAKEFLDPATDLLSTATIPRMTPGTMPDFPAVSATQDLSGDLYYTKRAETYYSYTNSGFGLKTGLFYRDINYRVTPEDRREAGGQFDLSYSPTGIIVTDLFGSYKQTSFIDTPLNNRDNQVGLRFLYRMTRYLSTSIEGRRTWRYSTDPQQVYTEDGVFVSLLYTSSALFVPRRR